MGSMEFACKVAGSKVVLVMGHTACGAIKGAIDEVQLGNLTALLAKIRPAIEATQYKGERTAKNYAFVDAVARQNVSITIANIREKSPVLRDLEYFLSSVNPLGVSSWISCIVSSFARSVIPFLGPPYVA
jgi:carbonic anhydrase